MKFTQEQTERDERFYSLVGTWKRAFEISLKSKKAYQTRLAELTTWDKPREDNKTEHLAKITALNILLA